MKIIKNIILSLLFLTALHLSVRYMGQVMFPKNTVSTGDDRALSQDYAQYYFSLTPRNSVDEVFIGSSHQFCSVDVNILNKNYGKNSILLASSNQGLKSSYYAVMEAIELQKPDTIVLEAAFVTRSSEEQVINEKHYLLDNMPNWSRTKWYAARDTGDEMYLYYYPLTALHGAWPDVKLKDFVMPAKLADGERYSYYYDSTTPMQPFKIYPPEEKGELPAASVKWLEKTVRLCQENDVELIMYIAPYKTGERSQRIFNALADFAEEHEIAYYNTMHLMDEIGIVFEEDFLDEKHLNYRGQKKMTQYIAEKMLS